MEAIIEKIKEYKIIVICTGLGLLVPAKASSTNTCKGNEFAG
ncbi:competence protein [Streptococcus pneumoniae]|nr:competence protein [Streptococcus pneumoniae]